MGKEEPNWDAVRANDFYAEQERAMVREYEKAMGKPKQMKKEDGKRDKD